MAAIRPVVTVFGEDKKAVPMPSVFGCPLRPDVVRLVHTNMAKNARQAVGLKDESGYDTAAASWGTGRAVARIPRVPGGGTHRAGQAAFGNMCRGGGMFNPTKTWRRWHRKTNTTQKRHSVCTALAASAIPALVMARGHKIETVPELPLVVSSSMLSGCEKTKKAIEILGTLGLGAELEKVKNSKVKRAGAGKGRNRRYVMAKGPLVVYDEDANEKDSVTRGFRNIPGVDLSSVNRLNLLQLAPGGHFGRVLVWTEAAFAKLNKIYGSYKSGALLKKGYMMPRSIMTNCDIARIINSSEVQSVLEVAKSSPLGNNLYRQKKNPLKNKSVMGRMCPAANKLQKLRRSAHVKGTATQKHVAKLLAKKKTFSGKHKKTSKAFIGALLEAHVPKVEEAAAATAE